VIGRIEELLKYETAGDPMTGLKWTRKTMDKIAQELTGLGISVSANTVARLLKQMEYSLQVNRKEIAFHCSADRNEQVVYLTKIRKRFAKQGNPTVSVDTKKKELVGQFKNAGAILSREPILVNDHDFRSTAIGMAIPYGIYDTGANHGMVFVGTSHDTPTFATEAIGKWWSMDGQRRYPGANHLLILADGGGSNGPTCRVWKEGIQRELCDRYGISVTVCHYPTGASKWNPVEHRLFSEISKNWAGHPLDSYETILNYIRTTKTVNGLRVRAHLVTKEYETGVKVSDERMRQLNIEKHKNLQRWNYTLAPRRM
jgi:hypothetical protein